MADAELVEKEEAMDIDKEVFPLTSLPFDLLVVVLQQLPAKSLALVSRVCTIWHRIESNPSMWSHNYQRAYLVDLSTRPEDPSAWKQLYITNSKELEPFDAKIRTTDPPTATPYSERAKHHFGLRHYEAAVNDWTTALSLTKPGDDAMTDILMERANLRQRLKRFPEMFADLEAAIKTDPTNADLICTCGMLASEEGFYDKAEDFFARAVEKQPHFLFTYLAKVDMYAKRELFDQALWTLGQALQVFPQNVEVLCRRARLHSQMGNAEMAVVDISSAIQLRPNRSDLYCWRGRFRLDLGLYEEAYQDLSAAIERDPRPGYFNWRSVTQLHLNWVTGAFRDAKEAIKRAPSSSQCMGMVCWVLGRSDLALRHFTTALTFHPKSGDFDLWCGRVALSMKDWPSALKRFDGAIKCNPDDINHFWRGLTHLSMGNIAKAWDDFQEAYGLNDAPPARISFWKGIVCLLEGKAESAEANFSEASKAAVSQTGIALALGRYSEPARVSFMRTKTLKFAKEQYTAALKEKFGADIFVTEEHYLKILVELFPKEAKLVKLHDWFRAKRKATFTFEGNLD